MSRWIRRAAIALAVLVATLVVAGLVVSLLGRSRLAESKERFVAVVGPLELAAFQKPDPPEEKNAARWLLAGAEALVVDENDMAALRRFLAAPLDAVPPEDLATARRLVELDRDALALLARATDLEASSFGIDYERGFDAEIPSHLDLLRAARLARVDARLAVLDGDTDRLARDLGIVDRMAAALTDEAALVTVLVGLSVDRDFLLLVHDVLTAGLQNSRLLEDLSRRLEDRDRTEALRRSFAAEGALALTMPMLELLGGELCIGARFDLVLFGSFQRAGLLDGWADLAGALDRPWVEIRRDFAPPPENEPRAPWDVHWFLLPNLLSTVERLKANASQTILAREAVATWRTFLADSVFPAQASFGADDPYTGEPFRFTTHPDGSVDLAAPGAAEIWRAENPTAEEDQRAVFDWTLRPPQEAPAARPAA